MRWWRLTAAGAILAGALLLGALLLGCGSSTRAPAAASSATARPGAGSLTAPSGVPPGIRSATGRSRGRRSLGSGESREVRRLIALGKPIYCASPRGREVALTFDDGPGPYTRLVIRKLRKHRAGATFFIVGRNIALDPGATRAERALGAVGDHTFTHPLLTSLAPAAANREIARTRALLARSSGGPVFLFRPPYGGRDTQIDALARANGLLQILWNVDSADSLGADYAQIERNVIAGLKPGSIILMHENHGQTVRALPHIFAALERRHLRAVSVSQLLTDQPPSLAQLRAGRSRCPAGPPAGLKSG
jgi:peptidoglycan/xylan/chitin deacetylase (PgdA/CDA1 family)